MGKTRQQVEEARNHIVTQPQEAGWLVSPKSIVQENAVVEWFGKKVDGRPHTIIQSTKYIAHTIAMWIILATRGYQANLMSKVETTTRITTSRHHLCRCSRRTIRIRRGNMVPKIRNTHIALVKVGFHTTRCRAGSTGSVY